MLVCKSEYLSFSCDIIEAARIRFENQTKRVTATPFRVLLLFPISHDLFIQITGQEERQVTCPGRQ